MTAPLVALVRVSTTVSSDSTSVSSMMVMSNVMGPVAPAANTRVVSAKVKSSPKVAVEAADRATVTANVSEVGLINSTLTVAVPASSFTESAVAVKLISVAVTGGAQTLAWLPNSVNVFCGNTSHCVAPSAQSVVPSVTVNFRTSVNSEVAPVPTGQFVPGSCPTIPMMSRVSLVAKRTSTIASSPL